ncbi:MAG TPA: hypothetical protein VM577_21230 [Anaerovoracaceae bacterium]|nr:hypothetical protein [Anaerovoracaceae bacterium]
MEIVIKGESKEIAALISAIQERQNVRGNPDDIVKRVFDTFVGNESKSITES